MHREKSDTETCVVQYDHKWLKDKDVSVAEGSINIPQIADDIPVAEFDEVFCTVCGGQGEGIVKRFPKKGGER